MRKPREPRAPRRAAEDEDIFGDAAASIAKTAIALDEALTPKVGREVAVPLADMPSGPPVEIVSETVPDELGRSTRQRFKLTDVAGKPATVHLEDAMFHWGLDPRDVLDWCGVPEEGLCLVTAGGCKLWWPIDIGRTLTDAEKGRATPPEPTRTILSEKYR